MSVLRLNLGCSDRHLQGYVNVDLVDPADQLVDLSLTWPWESGTIDEIIADDIVEHLPDPIHTMNETWRVLRPGGIVKIFVPTTDGRGAWQDPTHRSFWNRNSFFYYTDGVAERERFCIAYGVTARFQVTFERERIFPDKVVKLEIWLKAVKT